MRATGSRRDRFQARIVRDRQISAGEPVFKGTRVTLRTVLASLADGDSEAEVLAALPSLKPEDIQVAIAFAAASVEEDLPVAAVQTSDEVPVMKFKLDENLPT